MSEQARISKMFLEQRWWYRLLKVITIGIFIVSSIVMTIMLWAETNTPWTEYICPSDPRYSLIAEKEKIIGALKLGQYPKLAARWRMEEVLEKCGSNVDRYKAIFHTETDWLGFFGWLIGYLILYWLFVFVVCRRILLYIIYGPQRTTAIRTDDSVKTAV